MIPKKIVLSLLVLLVMAFAASAQETKTFVAQGDDLYAERGDLAKAKEALAKYREALAAGEDAYGVYWRLARVEYWTGDHTPDKTEKKRIFEQGIYHGKKAVQLNPDKADGHFWLGVCYGVYGEAKGVLKSLSLVKPIKEAMQRVLEIDPAYEKGGADQVLGRVYYELPGFAGGSKKKSLDHLLKAREYGPRVGLTLLYLSDTYIALDEVDKARECLDILLTMEPDSDLIPETAEEREQARKKLEGKPFKKAK